jgi:hypothetical protein
MRVVAAEVREESHIQETSQTDLYRVWRVSVTTVAVFQVN